LTDSNVSITSKQGAPNTASFPTGTVTLLFTDIEGSAAHWEERRATMSDALRRHEELIRRAIEEQGGYVFKTVGDAFCAAFWRATDGVAAAVEAQRTLVADNSRSSGGLRVRMALHSGTTEERDGDYFGPTVNRVARLLAVVQGGQVVVSGATAQLLRGNMPEGIELRDLGEHRLKDLVEPERVWQLLAFGIPDSFQPLSSLVALPNNLPRQLTVLIGRDECVAEVERLVEEHPLVTLVGTGGIGKTRVALQAGADLLDGSGDGVWFVDLGVVSDPSLTAGAIATTLGVREQQDRPVLQTLLHYLKRKRLLLILDNCEHVIDEIARIADSILHGCPDVRLLATSRELLRIYGERVYRVPSLAVPREEQARVPEAAIDYGAIALFVERAVASDARFRLTAENAPVVADICRRLDGIALAIELAAARVKALAPSQLAQKLEERFRTLTGGSRTALPRQQTMRALIDWSHDLLSGKEQRLFRRLAIFAGGWTLETVTAVCVDAEATSEDAIEGWEVLDILTSLVDKSLVQAELFGSETRYRLLESTRSYAHGQLVKHGEFEAIAHAHAAAFVAYAEQLEAVRDEMPDRAWLELAEPDLSNWRVALQWTLGWRADVELGLRLAGSLGSVWRAFAVPEGWRWTHTALGLVDRSTPPAVVADLKRVDAFLNAALLRFEAARQSAEQALRTYRQTGDEKGIATARYLVGRALVALGRSAEAESTLQQALKALRKLKCHRLTGVTLGTLATAREHANDFASARAMYGEALAVFKEVHDDRDAAVVATHLSWIEFNEGNLEAAISMLDEALSTFRHLNDRPNLVDGHTSMAEYAIVLERYDEGREHASAAVSLAAREQLDTHRAVALQHLVAAAVLHSAAQGNRAPAMFSRAAQLLGYVDACFARHGFRRNRGEQQLYDKTMRALATAIGTQDVAKHAAEGAGWSEERAVNEGSALV
jgi:predicted ATPase/class 3 adenylate cyclase